MARCLPRREEAAQKEFAFYPQPHHQPVSPCIIMMQLSEFDLNPEEDFLLAQRGCNTSADRGGVGRIRLEIRSN